MTSEASYLADRVERHDARTCERCGETFEPAEMVGDLCDGCDRAQPVNPDCAQGKHVACGGDAWDEDADALTVCACRCHDGEAETP